LQVWEAPEEMFVDDAFQDEEFVPKVLFETKDNEEPIDDVKFSPDGRYLATGSHDNWVDIYQVGGSWKKLGRCKGHSSWISHLDWSQDSTVIQSTDAAYEMLYWKPNGEQQTVCQRDQVWSTWTCTLGFWVMGIWQDGMNGSDINSVDRSKNVNRTGQDGNEFLVAADDNGKVWLFNYPAVIEDAPGHAFKGHASHVSNIRFSADDKRVISTGGHDRSLFQWKSHGVTEPSRHFKREAKRPVPRAGGDFPAPASRGKRELLEVQLEVREMERRTMDQKKVIQERDEEISRLMEKLGE
jgi:WD40 repeat protein